MTYGARFREKGQAWYVYHSLKSEYRRDHFYNSSMPIKIKGLTVVLLDESLVDRLGELAGKLNARFKVVDVKL